MPYRIICSCEVHRDHAHLLALVEGILNVIGKVDNVMDTDPSMAEAGLLVKQL